MNIKKVLSSLLRENQDKIPYHLTNLSHATLNIKCDYVDCLRFFFINPLL